ncbi:aminomethyltransferase, mitochondrial-like protein [Martensiomyces pterosporus]|nr:aminomethyltransferase, mitochondrial-like protein [Martensiomyces pterosporus]
MATITRSLQRSKLAIGPRLMSTAAASQRTALYDLHKTHGAKFGPFAGWDMPLVYADQGALDSHLHTRKHASIFDVSHMLQTRVVGRDRHRFLEHLVVADLQELPVGGSTLSLFTNEQGGIEDDTIITQQKDSLYVVSNAGCADKDLAHLQRYAKVFQDKGADVEVLKIEDHSLIALQGPSSQKALEKLAGVDLGKMPFMTGQLLDIKGIPCHVARSGYTGEDGFELSIPTGEVVSITEALLENPEVKLAGLGARDSLRLEAGLCLYGSDIDATTTPMEANLVWTIGKRRRAEGGFIGADIILDQVAKKGGVRRRVGLVVEGAPARAHAKVLSLEGEEIGEITSGVPAPSLGKNIAMAYVKKGFNKKDTELKVKVRNRIQNAKVVKMPFVPAGYHKI